MKSTFVSALVAALSFVNNGQSASIPRFSPNQLESGQALQNLKTQGDINFALSFATKQTRQCNAGNIRIRQEFTKMPKYMRKQFTDAVMCLYSKPSTLTGNPKYPGVKNRYDDYPTGHIEFDRFNHFSGTFLHWHRYVIWTFENDLRNLCGYTGTLPYWDWGMTAQQPDKAEIFNGDPYSMGSNGAYIPNGNPIVFTVPLPNSFLQSLPNPQTNITVPPYTGTGGGCINANGPFGKAQAHLGPTILNAYGPATGLDGLFNYNPRCIKRDLNPYITRKYTSYRNMTEAITNYTNIGDFQAVLQSDSRYAFTIGNIGVHAGGHVGAGGDPMADQPSTPGDPLWFLHHAAIDWMWTIWQNLDLDTRLSEVATTHTNLNYPPSSDVTLDDIVDLAYIGGNASTPRTVRDLASTVGGPFCYRYI